MSRLSSLSGLALARCLVDREASAVEATRDHLERIRSLDPALGTFLRVNPRALDEAEHADRLLACGRGGPLAGVPVAIKDNIGTAGLETTCASRILRGFVPARDATAVARLRRSGVVVLGKTNLDEFGMGSSTENSIAGPSRNPWDPQRVCGGSSGGSAAAVSAELAPLALGTDTGGSIRQPAAFCGVVGLKPTYGRVSRSGLIAFGSSLDQIGPLARTVRDAAAVLELIAGEDAEDATSSGERPSDYVAACERGVHGLRIGLPREYFDAALDAEVDAAARAAALELARQGATIEEVSLPHTCYAIPAYYLVATAEASSNLARYDGVRYGWRADAPESLEALYRRTRGAGFGPEVRRRIMLGTFALSAGYHDRFYGRAQRARSLVASDFAAVFGAGVQALLTPPTPTPPFRLGEKVEDPLAMYLSDVFTVTASLAGLPALVVPTGLSARGLPLGVQLVARALDEATLLAAGAALERAFGTLRPPLAREEAA
jgi:aspartyl-tRNA(Asn)/glutamyl-tRNA(Gln) amidotransferase subunit A